MVSTSCRVTCRAVAIAGIAALAACELTDTTAPNLEPRAVVHAERAAGELQFVARGEQGDDVKPGLFRCAAIVDSRLVGAAGGVDRARGHGQDDPPQGACRDSGSCRRRSAVARSHR